LAKGSISHATAIWIALLVTVLWSSSWVLIRIGLDDESLSPLTFAGLRYGTASLALLLWVASREKHRRELTELNRQSLTQLAILGLVFFTLTQGAQFIAIDNQPAATTSLVMSMTPLLVALVATRTLGESVTAQQAGGALLVAVGAWLYFSGRLGATSLGMLAAVIALFANVAGGLLGRSINRAALSSPVVVTAVSMSIGSVVLIVSGLVAEGWPTIGLRAALIISWLALVNTAVAFTLWNISLGRLSALESSALNNTMLIQIAVLAWWFLEERPGGLAFLGIALVSLGIFQIQLVAARRAPT